LGRDLARGTWLFLLWEIRNTGIVYIKYYCLTIKKKLSYFTKYFRFIHGAVLINFVN
jgi:hypothetical protein